MTDIQMLSGLVGILALLLALNLKLTFTLYKRVKQLPGFVHVPDALAEGAMLQQLSGKTVLNAKPELVWRQGSATAVLMFASRCPKCKEKLTEIPPLLLLTDGNGVEIKLVTNESVRHFRRFLADDKLAEHSIKVSQTDYLQLNPQQMSPAYLFISHQGQVEASGLIGDENWTLFCDQLKMFANVQQSVA